MKKRSFSYKYGETSCKNPAPILEGACVYSLAGDSCPGFDILIDTGGDTTFIPITVAAFLGLNVAAAPKHTVQFSNRTNNEYPMVYIKIFHGDFGYIGPIRASCVERESILLGRDALAWLLLIYDGHGKHLMVSQRYKMDTILLCCLRMGFRLTRFPARVLRRLEKRP